MRAARERGAPAARRADRPRGRRSSGGALHREHGAWGEADRSLGDAPEQQVLEPRVPARTDHDEVGGALLRRAHDRRGRRHLRQDGVDRHAFGRHLVDERRELLRRDPPRLLEVGLRDGHLVGRDEGDREVVCVHEAHLRAELFGERHRRVDHGRGVGREIDRGDDRADGTHGSPPGVQDRCRCGCAAAGLRVPRCGEPPRAWCMMPQRGARDESPGPSRQASARSRWHESCDPLQVEWVMDPDQGRDRKAVRVFLWTGVANLAVLVAKLAVGIATGSTAVLGDAVHSFADVSNNVVALLALHFAGAPPDREHPYGHRKYETLAVFSLAVLLAVLAVEVAMRSLQGDRREVVRPGWGLAVMLGVFVVNAAVSSWQGAWARRLDSDLLRADARHTLSDLLVTASLIAGWQAAARGHAWLDSAAALGVAGLILYLAYGLFRRAVPVLVDQSAADPDALRAAVEAIAGVRSTRRIRSRGSPREGRVDVVVTVDPLLPTSAAHQIADDVERVLAERFGTHDVTVHVEPHPGGKNA